MQARYSPEDLIKIRQSPLVCKPSSLPPSEEWMGPLQEQQSQKSQSKSQSMMGNFSREGNPRPSILETRHSTKGSNDSPSDIVLGPPKTAFVSSNSLKSPRTFDSPGRSAFGNFGGDVTGTDYFRRSKFNVEKEGDNDIMEQKREVESRGGRKSQEDQRVQAERDTGEEHEGRAQRRINRQGDWHNDGKKNGSGREGKTAWTKDDETFSGTKVTKEEKYANINNIRTRAWRDGDRGQKRAQDRDWDRNQHSEKNPEWMATDEPDQKKERHTAQDIEAWKAQMKAQNQAAKAIEQPVHAPTHSSNLPSKGKIEKPLTFDKGIDSFFNLWDKPQVAPSEPLEVSEDATKAQQAKFAKASRFTGFFGPVAPITPTALPPSAALVMRDPTQHLPTAEETAMQTYNTLFDETPKEHEDKAGFNRMLSMLRSSAPVADIGIPELPSNAMQAKENSYPNPSDPLTILSPRSQKKHRLESILDQPHQTEQPRGVINKDTEFLLNLLRKDEGWQQHFPSTNQPKATGPPQSYPSEEHFFEDRPYSERYAVDKLNPTSTNMRPPQLRSLKNPSDDFPNQPPFTDLSTIPRPLGFEQHVPPGFLMPARGPVHPPPGFGNRNQAMFPPGLSPTMSNLNLGGQDRAPPFMNTAPPGLFASHGGPPTFSPPFPMMGPGYFPGSNAPPPSRPPLMDMFGPMMGGDNGNKNGNPHQQQLHPGAPPGFPRQD